MRLIIQALLLSALVVSPSFIFAQTNDTQNNQSSRTGSVIYGDRTYPVSNHTPEAKEADIYIQKGRKQRDLKHYDSAIFYFQKALEITPKDGITYYRKAYIEQELGYYNTALSDYNFALKYAPYQANLYFNRAFVNLKLHNYQASIDDYTVEINKWSRYTNAYINRAIAKRLMGRFKDTFDEYDTILRIWPNSTLALSNKAWVNLYIGNTIEGMAGLNRLFSINPNFKKGLNHKMSAIYNNANYEECILMEDSIIAHFEELQWNYFKRGKANCQLHRYNEAITDYNKALEEYKTHPELSGSDNEDLPLVANNSKAQSEIALGMLDSAIAHCTIAIKLDSSYKQAFNTRGLAFYLKGQYKMAIKDYDAAIGYKDGDSYIYQPIYYYRDEAVNAIKTPLIYIEWLSPRDDINDTYMGTLFVASQKRMNLKLKISSTLPLSQEKIHLYQNGQIVDANTVKITMKTVKAFKVNYEYEINTLVTLPPYICTFKVGYENNYSQILTISQDKYPSLNLSEKAYYSWIGFND